MARTHACSQSLYPHGLKVWSRASWSWVNLAPGAAVTAAAIDSYGVNLDGSGVPVAMRAVSALSTSTPSSMALDCLNSNLSGCPLGAAALCHIWRGHSLNIRKREYDHAMKLATIDFPHRADPLPLPTNQTHRVLPPRRPCLVSRFPTKKSSRSSPYQPESKAEYTNHRGEHQRDNYYHVHSCDPELQDTLKHASFPTGFVPPLVVLLNYCFEEFHCGVLS